MSGYLFFLFGKGDWLTLTLVKPSINDEQIIKKKVDALLEGRALLRDDLKLSDTDSAIYYQLADARILLVFPDTGAGFFFSSEAGLTGFRKNIFSQKSGHILEGVFDDETEFYKSVAEAPNRLSVILSIPVNELDRSFNSLKKIDRQLKEQGIGFDTYEKYIYKYAICYMGEVIIKNIKGKWRFELYEGIFEPWVLLESGKLANVFIDLLDDAQEDWKNFSVFETAHLRLVSLQ